MALLKGRLTTTKTAAKASTYHLPRHTALVFFFIYESYSGDQTFQLQKTMSWLGALKWVPGPYHNRLPFSPQPRNLSSCLQTSPKRQLNGRVPCRQTSSCAASRKVRALTFQRHLRSEGSVAMWVGRGKVYIPWCQCPSGTMWNGNTCSSYVLLFPLSCCLVPILLGPIISHVEALERVELKGVSFVCKAMPINRTVQPRRWVPCEINLTHYKDFSPCFLSVNSLRP